MKKGWPWIIGLGIILIIVLAFLFGLGIMRIQGIPMNWIIGGRDVWRDGIWHHHGLRWGVPMMGVFWGLLMLLLVMGLLTLVVVGVVLLVRALQQPQRDDRSSSFGEHCHHCGKNVAPDWQVCPYCGERLKGE